MIIMQIHESANVAKNVYRSAFYLYYRYIVCVIDALHCIINVFKHQSFACVINVSVCIIDVLPTLLAFTCPDFFMFYLCYQHSHYT